MKKSKLQIKPEYIQDLYETYPNAFEVKEKDVKFKTKNNFIKYMKRNIETQKWIIENLGVTYIGYLDLLINTLNYDNEVNFSELTELGVKNGMINVIKKNLREANLVMKKGNKFYLNPMVAIRGETIDPEIVNLFVNQK